MLSVEGDNADLERIVGRVVCDGFDDVLYRLRVGMTDAELTKET